MRYLILLSALLLIGCANPHIQAIDIYKNQQAILKLQQDQGQLAQGTQRFANSINQRVTKLEEDYKEVEGFQDKLQDEQAKLLAEKIEDGELLDLTKNVYANLPKKLDGTNIETNGE